MKPQTETYQYPRKMFLVLVELLQFCQLKVDTMCGLTGLIHIINQIAPCTKHIIQCIFAFLTLAIYSSSYQTRNIGANCNKDFELGAPALISWQLKKYIHKCHNVCIISLRTVFERTSMSIAPISQLVWHWGLTHLIYL